MGKDKKKKKRQENEETQEQPKKAEEKETEKEQPAEEKKPEEVEEEKLPIIVPKKVQYCPVCTLPFQLCKFGKRAKDCKKFLQEAAPNKVSKYHPDDGNTEEPVKEDDSKDDKIPPVKKEKSIKDKYVVIDVKQRAKKKFVTQISGLQIFKIDSKDLTKKLSKKLACSCSATDSNTVQVQGDFYEDLRQMLIDEYKVKKRYILSGDQYKEKFKQEQEKKKEAKKLQSNVIKEEENEDEKEEPKPKYKTAMQQMLSDVKDEDDEEEN